MTNELLTQGYSVLAGSVFGSSIVFALAVIVILFVMLAILRLPANITLAFLFPVILAFCLFGYFPTWFRAISSIIIAIAWFFVIKGIIINE